MAWRALSGEARSRINAVYMSACFSGGVIGSLTASHAWDMRGWPVVVLCGAGFAMAVLVAGRVM